MDLAQLPSTCGDGAHNGDETCADCGGSCGQRCLCTTHLTWQLVGPTASQVLSIICTCAVYFITDSYAWWHCLVSGSQPNLVFVSAGFLAAEEELYVDKVSGLWHSLYSNACGLHLVHFFCVGMAAAAYCWPCSHLLC